MKLHKLCTSVVIAVILSYVAPSNAAEIIPAIAGNWKVTKVEFGRVSAISYDEAKAFIGKELEQYKGLLTSPFGSCNFCGLSMTYEKRTTNELGEEYPGIKFNLQNGYAIVHELTWGEHDSLTLIQVDSNTLYVPHEGAMFTLKINK